MHNKRNTHPVITLVKAWETFEENHPEGSIEDFCRHYLTQQDMEHMREDFQKTQLQRPPMRASDGLSATLGRMNKYMHFYSRKIMQNLPVDNFEDWAYLATLHFHGGMRKSDLINQNISEFTSGTNVINRLLKQELIEEFTDPSDARSKRVQITGKGVDWIITSLPAMKKASDLLWDGVLSEEEQEVAYHILLKADRYHSGYFTELRNLKVEEIIERLKSR